MPRQATRNGAQYTAFGRWLEEQYTRLHFNMTGFAELLGIPHSTVSDWMYGKTKPRDSSIRKIARGLNIPESEIHRALGRAAPPSNGLPDDVRRIRDILLLLPPGGRAIVESTARSVAEHLPEPPGRESDEDHSGKS